MDDAAQLEHEWAQEHFAREREHQQPQPVTMLLGLDDRVRGG
jgi:hypothetical protein